ncbi:uncharacterized protein SPPG_07518 [Spizellomyces punctatus DAOM BR117]|uniref:C2H2-type domain-containing protein n=1 Tax=Spizellomyces punctatus (strain DAOM BR117) TaxID=645134 RepID=A0A0L0H864_SPIPD|nr:uncharacterized protein SPPG_07518 [Spizellomyces punctatus DAOM BR117]KNC97126.1 hypothetical protein SPPG_07518 [Spizellomyces punctatus DAOM BR117]|eukprot:XP_016605166.1 hypothetical protein SPPG_07518 [Spizellomyces punctatus DAOM BR117]
MTMDQYTRHRQHGHPVQRSQSDPMLSMPRSAYPYSPSDHLSPQYPVPSSPVHHQHHLTQQPHQQQQPQLPQQQQHGFVVPSHMPWNGYALPHIQMAGHMPMQMSAHVSLPNLVTDPHFQHPQLHHHQQQQHYNNNNHQQHQSNVSMFHPSPTGTGLPSLPTPVFSTFEDILSASSYHSQHSSVPADIDYHPPSHQTHITPQQQWSPKAPTVQSSLPTPPFSAPTSGGELHHSRIPPPLAPPTSPSDCSTAASETYSLKYEDPMAYDDGHSAAADHPSSSSSPHIDYGLPSGTVTPSSTWSSPAPSIPTSPVPPSRQSHQNGNVPTQPRVYRCFVPDCPKTYGTGAGLRYHLRHFHKMSHIPRQPPVRVARVKPDFYPCPKCSKQYSTAAGLRYHKKTFTHPEDVAASLSDKQQQQQQQQQLQEATRSLPPGPDIEEDAEGDEDEEEYGVGNIVAEVDDGQRGLGEISPLQDVLFQGGWHG